MNSIGIHKEDVLLDDDGIRKGPEVRVLGLETGQYILALHLEGRVRVESLTMGPPIVVRLFLKRVGSVWRMWWNLKPLGGQTQGEVLEEIEDVNGGEGKWVQRRDGWKGRTLVQDANTKSRAI